MTKIIIILFIISTIIYSVNCAYNCSKMNCTGTDKCKNYICDTNFGCMSYDKCSTNNMCQVASCNALTGNCTTSSIKCDDGNSCTIDFCDPLEGCWYATKSNCNLNPPTTNDCSSPTQTPTSTPSSTPSSTPTSTPSSTPSSTPTQTPTQTSAPSNGCPPGYILASNGYCYNPGFITN